MWGNRKSLDLVINDPYAFIEGIYQLIAKSRYIKSKE